MTLTRYNGRELWWAFLAIGVVTAVYFLGVSQLQEFPPASSLFGHSIGIIGFILMLMTETLYTLRKRSRNARWGRMSTWLDLHIFTGIVGPYMVLLHTSWKFNGLAGVTMLLTIIIVISGFIGRYIYTSLPRTVDGAELESSQIEQEIMAIETKLQTLLGSDPGAAQAIMTQEDTRASMQPGGSRKPGQRTQDPELKALQKRQAVLRRQESSLIMARRLLALWHTIHIPIGMALFTAAFIHVAASIYYATLLR